MTRSVPALATLLLLAAAPAAAEGVLDLVRADPANRAGEREVSRAIVRMVAERSESPAVRARASTEVAWGRLAVGPDEVLAEIGAVAALGGPRAVPPVVRPEPTPPAPVAQPAAPRTAPPAAPKPPAAKVEPAKAEAPAAPKRYLGIFVVPEPQERGGGGGGGGGGW